MSEPADTTTVRCAAEDMGPLRQSDATMLVLHAVRQGSRPVPRLLMEGIASIARSPLCENVNSRILGVFRTRSWRRCLYESLAHLDTNRFIRSTSEGYAITPAAEERVRGIRHSENELVYIRDLAETVRDKLGIGRG